MADKKIVKILMLNGSEVGCLTQMPESEIVKELEGLVEGPDGDWIRLECLTAGHDERVVFALQRHTMAGYFIQKYSPSQIAVPRGPALVGN